MKNICFITTSRADYGLLKPLIKLVDNDINYNYFLIVSGSHLSHKFGYSCDEIEKDFNITKKIDINIDSNENSSVCKYMGMTQILFSEYLTELNNNNNIDLVVLLGDRFEIFSISQVCFILKLKLCHLAGGDITEGAIDNVFRNSISLMADYHMPTCEKSRYNLLNLGIKEDKICLLGNPGLEELNNYKPELDKNEFRKKYNMEEDYILVVFHPETMIVDNEYINIFFEEIKKSNFQKVVIKSNCDPNYNLILDQLNSDNCKSFLKIDNLPRNDYLSLAFYSNYYVGNSSSGLYEIPYLKTPVINVGNRQKGRQVSKNIINCNYEELGDKILKIEENKFYCNKVFLNISNLYKIYNSSSIFLDFLKNEFKV